MSVCAQLGRARVSSYPVSVNMDKCLDPSQRGSMSSSLFKLSLATGSPGPSDLDDSSTRWMENLSLLKCAAEVAGMTSIGSKDDVGATGIACRAVL
jgi:hypothetical protein